MNNRLRKTNTYLRKLIGNSGEVIINLNKNNAGLFIEIPIFTIEGISNFNFSLIYSSFSLNNCLHYVNELLKRGYNYNPIIQKLIVNSEEFIPIKFLNNIEDKQKIKNCIRVYVPVIQN